MKEALKARNLVTEGRKSVFIMRLEMNVKNGMAKVENIDPTIIENIYGAGIPTNSILLNYNSRQYCSVSR